MTKAYWIGHATVDDPETYVKYRETNAVAFAKYHCKCLTRGGAQDLKEGALRPRSVTLEFKSIEAAQACYNSPEYQRTKDVRDPVSLIDLVIVEGYEA